MDLKKTITENIMTAWFLMGHQYHREPQGFDPDHPHRAWFNPSRGRGRIIALLQIKDGLSTKELAHVLDIRVSSLNETLGKMEKLELIERRPSTEDKRVQLVYLTEKGRQAEVAEAKDIDLFKGFTEEELDQLASYTERMMNNAAEGLDEQFLATMREHMEARSRLMEQFGDPQSPGHNPPIWTNQTPPPHRPGNFPHGFPADFPSTGACHTSLPFDRFPGQRGR